MSSSFSPPILSRPVVPHITSSCSSCHTPFEFPAPQPAPPARTLLHIQCFHCQSLNEHAFYPGQVPGGTAAHAQAATGGDRVRSGAGTPQPARKGRKIGTQERPLETAYYDLLEVPITATTDDIKKAYRRAAIKHHPDKNRDDPNAEERFKDIAIAYQTLSDPALRKKYNEFGPHDASAPEGGFVDPEAVFGAMFGGARFEPLIGQISLAQDMKTALQEADEAEDGAGGAEGAPREVPRDAKGREIISLEEKAKRDEKARKVAAEKAAAREERVRALVVHLERKLAIFAEQATGPDDLAVSRSWRQICAIEAGELKDESYGVELLHAIGHAYASKGKQHLATQQTLFGIGGWYHNVQSKAHVFSETVSTLRAAMELKGVFDQLAAAEKAGNLSADEKRKLEEQAAEKGLQALFKGTKLEIDSVLRETCERVLEDQTVPPQKRALRAIALQIMGEAYMAVRKDGGSIEDDGAREEAEYVRVETKASREREKTRGAS